MTVAARSPSTPCVWTIPSSTTTNAPVGPAIWTWLPPKRETTRPATTPVTRPRAGSSPDAIANAIASGIATIPTTSPASASRARVSRRTRRSRSARTIAITSLRSLPGPGDGDAGEPHDVVDERPVVARLDLDPLLVLALLVLLHGDADVLQALVTARDRELHLGPLDGLPDELAVAAGEPRGGVLVLGRDLLPEHVDVGLHRRAVEPVHDRAVDVARRGAAAEAHRRLVAIRRHRHADLVERVDALGELPPVAVVAEEGADAGLAPEALEEALPLAEEEREELLRLGGRGGLEVLPLGHRGGLGPCVLAEEALEVTAEQRPELGGPLVAQPRAEVARAHELAPLVRRARPVLAVGAAVLAVAVRALGSRGEPERLAAQQLLRGVGVEVRRGRDRRRVEVVEGLVALEERLHVVDELPDLLVGELAPRRHRRAREPAEDRGVEVAVERQRADGRAAVLELALREVARPREEVLRAGAVASPVVSVAARAVLREERLAVLQPGGEERPAPVPLGDGFLVALAGLLGRGDERLDLRRESVDAHVRGAARALLGDREGRRARRRVHGDGVAPPADPRPEPLEVLDDVKSVGRRERPQVVLGDDAVGGVGDLAPLERVRDAVADEGRAHAEPVEGLDRGAGLAHLVVRGVEEVAELLRVDPVAVRVEEREVGVPLRGALLLVEE